MQTVVTLNGQERLGTFEPERSRFKGEKVPVFLKMVIKSANAALKTYWRLLDLNEII